MNSMERRIAMQKVSDATPCAPYAPLGCSKSESATPLTDAVFAKCKARPTDGSGSRDGGWGAADIADFLRHSRKLEIALGGAVSALREIAEAQGDQSLSLQVRGFELVGRMQGAASVALDMVSTLNPESTGQEPHNAH